MTRSELYAFHTSETHLWGVILLYSIVVDRYGGDGVVGVVVRNNDRLIPPFYPFGKARIYS